MTHALLSEVEPPVLLSSPQVTPVCVVLRLAWHEIVIDSCSNFVLSETLYMVGNACLSQAQDNGGNVVVEPVYSIGIVVSIMLCLLDAAFLGIEELFHSTFLLHSAFHICTGHFQVLICLYIASS